MTLLTIIFLLPIVVVGVLGSVPLILGSGGLLHEVPDPEAELVVIGPETMSEIDDGPPAENAWVVLNCPNKGVVLPLTAHDNRTAAEESVANTTFDAAEACADWDSEEGE